MYSQTLDQLKQRVELQPLFDRTDISIEKKERIANAILEQHSVGSFELVFVEDYESQKRFVTDFEFINETLGWKAFVNHWKRKRPEIGIFSCTKSWYESPDIPCRLFGLNGDILVIFLA